MASDFEDAFGFAMDSILGRIGVSAVLTDVDGTTTTITVTFNEQVGFVDNRRRAVFTVDRDDLPSGGGDRGIERGAYFVISGETERWVIVDVRDDKAGGVEMRCDGTLERL